MILRGKYCLLQEIGRGGEGVVYLARDLELGKRWCVKKTARSPGLRLACRLEHDHFPQVADYWEEQEDAYIVMEYIPGQTLRETLQQKNITAGQRMRWSRQLVRAVRMLHRQVPPLVYGDLKPENLMVSSEGQLYLIDFGSVRILEKEQKSGQKGTKGYAAPEQQEGRLLIQSDIYGIGRILELLWKKQPGSRRLRPVLRKCLRSNAGERYADCRELEKDLERCFGKMQEAARTRVFLPLLLAGLAVMLLTGISFSAREAVLPVSEEKEAPVPEEDPWTAFHRKAVLYFSAEEGREEAFADIWEAGMKLLRTEENDRKGNILLLLARVSQEQEEERKATALYRQWMRENPEETEGIAFYGMFLLQAEKEAESWELYLEKRKLLSETDSRSIAVWKENLKQWKERMDEEKKSKK